MARRPTLVVTFRSVHDVMKAEARLRAAGVWCDVIPAPREITSDCGMVVEILAADTERVLGELGLAEGGGARWEGLYAPAGGAYGLLRRRGGEKKGAGAA